MQIPNNDNDVLKLLYGLTKGYPYKPASHTSIRKFTDSFSKEVKQDFKSIPALSTPEWIPEAPYPRIYTKDYKKTILSTLK